MQFSSKNKWKLLVVLFVGILQVLANYLFFGENLKNIVQMVMLAIIWYLSVWI